MVGYSNVILEILQKRLNFTVEPKQYSSWGYADKDGRWNGVIGDLIRKELDFSPMDFTPTKESREVIDFTDWVSEDPVVIVSAAPQPQIRPWLLLEIFNPWFYLLLPVVLVSCGILLWIFIQLNMTLLSGVYAVPKKHTFSKVIPSSIKTIVSQCLKDVPTGFSSRIILISTWFMSFILDAAYQGHITSFIAMPRFTPAIDNHEQLSANSSVIPVTESYSTTYTMIVESDRKSFQMLTQRLETYNADFLDSGEFFHGIAVGKWAYVDSHSSTYGRALNFESTRSRCKFYVSRDSIIGGLDAWPFPRNSPVHSQISRAIKWMRYFGILEKIKSEFYVPSCTDTKTIDGPKKLNLRQLQGVFYVVMIGLVSATVVFIAEIIHYKVQQCFV